MKISDKGINILKQLEGCVKYGNKHIVYNDQNGRPINSNEPLPKGATIGYGHLIKSGEDYKNGITESKATELLRKDVCVAENAVKNNITVSLTQNQYDALVIFAYNIGVQNFIKSTVVKYINNPNFQSVVYPNLDAAWLAWNKSNGREMSGLTNRRVTELELFKC